MYDYTSIATAQLACYQVGKLKERGDETPEMMHLLLPLLFLRQLLASAGSVE